MLDGRSLGHVHKHRVGFEDDVDDLDGIGVMIDGQGLVLSTGGSHDRTRARDSGTGGDATLRMVIPVCCRYFPTDQVDRGVCLEAEDASTSSGEAVGGVRSARSIPGRDRGTQGGGDP